MVDRLIDTNVLIVASATSGLDRQYEDVPVSIDEVATVFTWVNSFRTDPDSDMVLDEAFKIYDEYRNKLTDQHFGLQVVHDKMARLRTVSVDYDGNGYGIVPAELGPIDNSDKKFVAAALNDPTSIHIVNATDSDWHEQRELLRAHGIIVEELLP